MSRRGRVASVAAASFGAWIALAPGARTDALSTQTTTSLERTQAVVQKLLEDCIPLSCPDEEVAFYKNVLQDIARMKQQQRGNR